MSGEVSWIKNGWNGSRFDPLYIGQANWFYIGQASWFSRVNHDIDDFNYGRVLVFGFGTFLLGIIHFGNSKIGKHGVFEGNFNLVWTIEHEPIIFRKGRLESAWFSSRVDKGNGLYEICELARNHWAQIQSFIIDDPQLRFIRSFIRLTII